MSAVLPESCWQIERNPLILPMNSVPLVPVEQLGRCLAGLAVQPQRLVALFAGPRDADHELFAVLADDERKALAVVRSPVAAEYPSFTPLCPQAHLFEREIFEQQRILPQHHPWLKPVRFPSAAAAACGEADFYQVAGDEVHEVAVGPVHAGVIEPGHFRFQCRGEEVLHLEISLGYQHRGIEAALAGGPDRRSATLIETAAGDTSVGHMLAYCQLLEGLLEQEEPPRASALRTVALELERLANHTGDLGALANDIAYLPTASYGGRHYRLRRPGRRDPPSRAAGNH